MNPWIAKGRTSLADTLIVVASEREGLGLVDEFGLKRAVDFKVQAGDHERGLGLYRGKTCDVLISGVLEHHMVAATALCLHRYEPRRVVNFGACGTYGNRFGLETAPKIESVVTISTSYRFDVDDNLHWIPPRTLPVVDLGLATANCVTGSRYSRVSDYDSIHFPKDGHVEDMELYGLAVLMETFSVPLHSIKYVTNDVGPSGREQFRKHVVPARRFGYEALENVLSKTSEP